MLREDPSFEMERDDLSGPLGPFSRTAPVDIARPLAVERHVRSPVVVPVGEAGAHPLQVVEALDERHRPQPFVLERLDDPLGDRDAAVLADRTEPVLDAAAGAADRRVR